METHSPSHYVTRRLLVETLSPDRHLIFNPLSGAVDLVSADEMTQIEQMRAGKAVIISPAIEQDLRRRRILFDNAAQEEEFLEDSVAQAWTRMQTLQPEVYTVCPTLACNLACSYCFEGDSLTDKKQGAMTSEQVAQMFQAIASIRRSYPVASPYAPWIALFGGEPLLPTTHECVGEICRHAAEGGFLIGGTTNGVNLVRFTDILTEYADLFTSFQVSLDGPQAMHDSRRHRLGGQGTFKEIVRGIDLLLSLNIGVDLRMNLDAQNLETVPELVDFIYDKGWHRHPDFQLALAPVTVHQDKGCHSKYDHALSELELARQVLAQIEQNPRMAEMCHMGFLRHLEYLVNVLEPEKLGRRRKGAEQTSIGPRYWYCEASTDKQYVFTPEGLIYNCTEAVGQPRHAIGKFGAEFEIWKPQQKEWVGRTILSHPKCRTCSISTLCGGGCNLASRERQSSDQINLLQISIKGRGNETVPTPIQQKSEPFCNAAEDTVRAYLQYVGQTLVAAYA